jgi:hypothetical protein
VTNNNIKNNIIIFKEEKKIISLAKLPTKNPSKIKE